DQYRAACGDRRADLVDDEVDRVVEGAEGQYRADGLTLREGDAVSRSGGSAHANHVTTLGSDQFRAIAHPVDGAVHLHDRVAVRFPAFGYRRFDQTVAPFGHQLCRFAQDLDSYVWGQPLRSIA